MIFVSSWGGGVTGGTVLNVMRWDQGCKNIEKGGKYRGRIVTTRAINTGGRDQLSIWRLGKATTVEKT